MIEMLPVTYREVRLLTLSVPIVPLLT